MGATMTIDELEMDMLSSRAAGGLAWSLVEDRLIRWGLSEDGRGDARLILSELVANAIAVTRAGRTIRIHCKRDIGGILIGVWDESPKTPIKPAPVKELEPDELDVSEMNWDNNGGWGLAIVQALSKECGVTSNPSGRPGKTVWARMAWK